MPQAFLACCRPPRLFKSVRVAPLWTLALLLSAAGLGAASTLEQHHRRPWLTLYAPLRLGVDPIDDDHALSALGTWLRLDCPAGEEDGLPVLSLPRHEDVGPAGVDVIASDQPAWPMPDQTLSAVTTPPDIIFFTDDGGETCNLLNAALGLQQQVDKDWEDMPTRVRCLDECVHPRHRRLGVACIIQHASSIARTPVMSLVNSDIALGADFVRAMQGLFFQSAQGAAPTGSAPQNAAGDSMLVIGRRTDLHLPTPRIDFSDGDWAAGLRNLAAQQGLLHSEYGIDYLATTRPGIWARPDTGLDEDLPGKIADAGGDQVDPDIKTTLFMDDGDDHHHRPSIAMPPFLVGVYRWDSFAVARAILSPSIAVVDATAAVVAAHLQRAQTGKLSQHRHRRGASYSDRLVHNLIGRRFLMGHTLNADYELTAGGELVARVGPLAM